LSRRDQDPWSRLGSSTGERRAAARAESHRAAQWPSKAARANLAAVPDDSHSSLGWDHDLRGLRCHPLQIPGGQVSVGLDLEACRLEVTRDGAPIATIDLAGLTDDAVGRRLDSILEGLSLKPASPIELPYELGHSGRYSPTPDSEALAELAAWYAVSATLLDEIPARFPDLLPGASPVRCWPHHFDIATLVSLEPGDPEVARSIGVGMSPGDETLGEPYFYINPWPCIDAADLPSLARGGHWVTTDTVGAMATATEILALDDRREDLTAFLESAIRGGLSKLGLS
jgi:hypothetical protein